MLRVRVERAVADAHARVAARTRAGLPPCRRVRLTVSFETAVGLLGLLQPPPSPVVEEPVVEAVATARDSLDDIRLTRWGVERRAILRTFMAGDFSDAEVAALVGVGHKSVTSTRYSLAHYGLVTPIDIRMAGNRRRVVVWTLTARGRAVAAQIDTGVTQGNTEDAGR